MTSVWYWSAAAVLSRETYEEDVSLAEEGAGLIVECDTGRAIYRNAREGSSAAETSVESPSAIWC
jgi:hypothetical protein